MKTPPLDRADNGRLFDDTEEDGFKTPGSLGYWSQGLNIPAKIVITIKLDFRIVKICLELPRIIQKNYIILGSSIGKWQNTKSIFRLLGHKKIIKRKIMSIDQII